VTNRPPHRFGGSWTDEKLHVLGGYLAAYTTALSKQRFSTGYVDAFAGTGYRDAKRPDETGLLELPDLAEAEPQELLEGSARIALRVTPRFSGYVFIESHAGRRAQLEHLKTEFPELKDKIQIRPGDANQQIQEICRLSWNRRRAVLFLDPYGMQVEWTTIAAVAATKAIDMWLLFPLGIGVNRLLTRDADIPPAWRERLNALLGTDRWFEEFYEFETTTNLFGDEETRIVKASTDTIGKYFVRRLETVFAGVAQEPRVLVNSRGCPLYLLCFAVGNPKGAPIALQIANHLLRPRAWS
jgi:three-Cys-motif partner protein